MLLLGFGVGRYLGGCMISCLLFSFVGFGCVVCSAYCLVIICVSVVGWLLIALRFALVVVWYEFGGCGGEVGVSFLGGG